jgi:sugar-phosphatase
MASPIAPSRVQIRCQAILFDMDGILISSLGSVERSWTKYAQMRGLDPESTIEMAHGCRAIETVARLRPDLDAEAELKVIEELEIEDNEGLTVLPGVHELLASLPPDRWTVVTSATERLARSRMAAAGIPVPRHLVTADMVTRGKPHPEPFLAGAALLGFAPHECVVFEDSSSGAQAGRAAGCTVIATTFSHSVKTLDAAHYLIRDVTGVTATALPAAQGLTLDFTPIAG